MARSVVIVAPNSFDRFLEESGTEIRFQLRTRSLHPAALFNLSLLANPRSRPPRLQHGMKRVNPMAGYYLESFLKLRGWEARTVFDWADDEALREAMAVDPVAVLFSTTYITNNPMLETCIRALRGVIGRTPLLIGGPYIWKQRIELLRQGRPIEFGAEQTPLGLCSDHPDGPPGVAAEALKEFGVDALGDNLFSAGAGSMLRDATYVASEFGEHTVAGVLEWLESGGRRRDELHDLSNLVIAAGDDGWLATNSEPEPFDLDRDFTRWDLIDTLPEIVPMRTSVGCPYRCRYCDFIELHPKVTLRSPGSILEEVKLVRARGGRVVNFIDDNIFLSKKRVARLTRELLEQDAGIYWGGFFRVDRIDEDNIDDLWQSGCRWGLCGIESGDAGMLGLMRKGCRSQEIQRGVDLATAAGMQLKLTFIVGFPGETRESIDNTVAFVNGLSRSNRGYASYQIYPFYLLPCTAVDEPEFRARYRIHGRFSQWTHSTMSFEEAATVWSPYFFRNVDGMPYEYYVTDSPLGWSVERRARAFQLRKELTLAFLDELDDEGIQERFEPLYELLCEAPPERVPSWQEIFADRAHQPGAQHVNAW